MASNVLPRRPTPAAARWRSLGRVAGKGVVYPWRNDTCVWRQFHSIAPQGRDEWKEIKDEKKTKVIGRNNKKKVNFSLADHERNRGGKPRLRGGGGCLNKEEKTNFHAFAALHDSLVPVCRCVLEKKFKTAAFTLLYFLVSWGSRFFSFLDEFMTLAKPWGRFTREVPEKKKKKTFQTNKS